MVVVVAVWDGNDAADDDDRVVVVAVAVRLPKCPCSA